MKPETKADLEKALGHKVDETDIKIFEILQECGESKDAQTVHGFSVGFGRKCFEMGQAKLYRYGFATGLFSGTLFGMAIIFAIIWLMRINGLR